MRLLVVEDDRDLNESLSRRLKKAGNAVDSCFDGEEAIDYISAGEFDAVILDIMMPKKAGSMFFWKYGNRGILLLCCCLPQKIQRRIL